MYLSKLVVNVTSREFRRDYTDIREMHRTVMSAYTQVTDGTPARQSHAVLWRLDGAQRGFTQYVQSRSQPDWSYLPEGYLAEPPLVRELQPLIDAIAPGRRFAFRMVANPTRTVGRTNATGAEKSSTAKQAQGKKIAIHLPDKQIEWLVRQADRYGFVIPTGANGQPDVAPSPCPTLTGRPHAQNPGTITVAPVRFEGHLIVTDHTAFIDALRNGIGRAKAYGCGLISLAPARTQ
jgi:CRISPR system Cascade subunit CasE